MRKFYEDYFGTFCIYCQRDFYTEGRLFSHIDQEHPGTYAKHSIDEIRQRRLP
jgi:hypothetical protein